MAQLSLFTFGYWGWGSETPLLLKVTAAAEKARGFAPPCFVDIRAKRSVRAAGFRDSAMEKLAGKERYMWMPKLGNRRVAEHTDGKAEIIEPDAVDVLLDLALERARSKQRIISSALANGRARQKIPDAIVAWWRTLFCAQQNGAT